MLTIVDRSTASAPVSAPSDGLKPLGEMLVESGVVSQTELNQVLSQQKRVGEILVEQKAAIPEQISEALKKQSENAPTKKAETPSIRVDTVQIDRLINLVDELVITQSMLSDLASRFEMSQLPVLLERVARVRRSCTCAHSNVFGQDCGQSGSCRHEARVEEIELLGEAGGDQAAGWCRSRERPRSP